MQAAVWWEEATWHEALVWRLKELQSGSRLGKERWLALCRSYGASFDPSVHETGFLASFFEALEAEGWTLPPLPPGSNGSCYGAQWGGGKGKSWASSTVAPYQQASAKGFAAGGKVKGGGPGATFWGADESCQRQVEVKESYGGNGKNAAARFGSNNKGAPCEKGGCWGGKDWNSTPGKASFGSSKGEAGNKGWPQQVSEKLFVGNLPRAAGEADIMRYFSQFGDVADVKLKLDGEGRSRCFAFVTFASSSSAQAVANCEAIQMDGRWLDCKPAAPDVEKGSGGAAWKGGSKGLGKLKEQWTEGDITEKIFIGGLPQGTTEPEVRLFCEQFGKTREVALKYNSDCVFRGFAFVSFASVESARELLRHAESAYIGGRLTEVRPARPSENYHQAKKQDFVDNSEPTPIISPVIRVAGLLPEPKARDVFKLFYNFSMTRIRDCGGNDVYVEFNSSAEAEQAYRSKKDATLSGVKVQLTGASREEFAAAAQRMHNLLPKSLQAPLLMLEA